MEFCTTDRGVGYVRTLGERFDEIGDYSDEPRYIHVDGLRMT